MVILILETYISMVLIVLNVYSMLNIVQQTFTYSYHSTNIS